MVEDEELELGQGMESSFLAEEMGEGVKRKEQISSEACQGWSLDVCQSFFAALGAEVEEVGVGGWVIQINSVMSIKGEEEGGSGEGVILVDGTEEGKGRSISETILTTEAKVSCW